MKLITETTFNDIEYLTEANAEGGKDFFVQGVFLQGNIKNRNGRVYPMEVLSREVKRYGKSFIEDNRAYGELGHPNGPTINPERISHRIVGLKQEGDNFIGKAKIAGTPYGQIARTLMAEGGKLGVSSRGIGSLKQEKGGNVVQKDFMLATAADIVTDPSAPDAFVEGVMENVEWMQLEDGSWIPDYIEETKTRIVKASNDEIEQVMLESFDTLVKNLTLYK